MLVAAVRPYSSYLLMPTGAPALSVTAMMEPALAYPATTHRLAAGHC
jgi:hypothetical protein